MEAEQKYKVIKHWLNASEMLNFRIKTPFFINIDDNEFRQAAAYLPDYGTPKGMIFDVIDISKGEETDKRIWDWAKDNGIFCSFINFQSYKDYDEKLIIETLKDWGYFGNKKLKKNA